MDYRLELLDEHTFEDLVNLICQKLLGMGVINFSKGKDGGRDGKFQGTADNYPSSSGPWSGIFVIQAKHTENPIASCSDRGFRNEVINKESPKIRKLKDKNEIDCYLIFTNRKYSGINGEKLLNEIREKTGVLNSIIIGKESINKLYLNPNKDIVRTFGLDKFALPFDFSDEELKEIILSFKEQLPDIECEIKAEVERLKYDYSHISKSEKNEKNKLGEEYYQNEIVGRSLIDFEKIEVFLNNPINSDLKDYYFDIAAELSSLITIKRGNFDAFEEIFIHIYQSICTGNAQLKGSKRHVMTLLHYMYFECLIGMK